MLQHSFLMGRRILLKNKFFSSINIGGLAIGMTVAILTSLWIADELTFNTQHQHYERIVQVLRRNVQDNVVFVNSSQVGQLGLKL